MGDEEVKSTPEEDASPSKKAGIPMVVIIVVVAIVVGAGGFFAGKMMSGGDGENGKQSDNVEQTADQIPDDGKKNGKKENGDSQQTNENDGVIDGEIKDDVEEDPKESDGKKEDDTVAVKRNPGILILDEFTVNLNDPFGRRYSNIYISLEVIDKEIVNKIKTNELLIPKIRNEILMIISSKSYNELKTTSGKITLKEEILMRLNEILQEQFTEDVMKKCLVYKILNPMKPPINEEQIKKDLNYEESFKESIKDLDEFVEVPLKVNVVLGKKMVKISDLIDLAPGSLLDLKRSAGESLLIYLEDSFFAKGEITIIEDTFGVRITEINDPRKV